MNKPLTSTKDKRKMFRLKIKSINGKPFKRILLERKIEDFCDDIERILDLKRITEC